MQYALGFVVHQSLLTKARLDDSEMLRRTYTAIAEAFVLVHESTHLLHRVDTDASSKLQQFYVELLRDFAELQDESQETTEGLADPHAFAVSYFDDYDRAWLRRYGEIPDTDEARQARQDAVDRMAQESMDIYSHRAEVEKVISNPNLLEECVCDAVSALISIGWADELGVDFISATRACHLALLNLRFIKQVDAHVMGIETADDDPMMTGHSLNPRSDSVRYVWCLSYGCLHTILGRRPTRQPSEYGVDSQRTTGAILVCLATNFCSTFNLLQRIPWRNSHRSTASQTCGRVSTQRMLLKRYVESGVWRCPTTK